MFRYSLMTPVSDLKDEIINLKEVIIKKLQDDNAMLANELRNSKL